MKFTAINACESSQQEDQIRSEYHRHLENRSISGLLEIAQKVSLETAPFYKQIYALAMGNALRIATQEDDQDKAREIIEKTTSAEILPFKLEHYEKTNNHLNAVFTLNRMLQTESLSRLIDKREYHRRMHRISLTSQLEKEEIVLIDDVYTVIWKIYYYIIDQDISNIDTITLTTSDSSSLPVWYSRISQLDPMHNPLDHLSICNPAMYTKENQFNSKMCLKCYKEYTNLSILLTNPITRCTHTISTLSTEDISTQTTDNDIDIDNIANNDITNDIDDVINYNVLEKTEKKDNSKLDKIKLAPLEAIILCVNRLINDINESSLEYNPSKHSIYSVILVLLDYIPIDRYTDAIANYSLKYLSLPVITALEKKNNQTKEAELEDISSTASSDTCTDNYLETKDISDLITRVHRKLMTRAWQKEKQVPIIPRREITESFQSTEAFSVEKSIVTLLQEYLADEAEEQSILEWLVNNHSSELHCSSKTYPLCKLAHRKALFKNDLNTAVLVEILAGQCTLQRMLLVYKYLSPVVQSYYLLQILYLQEVPVSVKVDLFTQCKSLAREMFVYNDVINLLLISPPRTHLLFFSQTIKYKQLFSKTVLYSIDRERISLPEYSFNRSVDLINKYLNTPQRMYMNSLESSHPIYPRLIEIFKYKKEYRLALAINPFNIETIVEYIQGIDSLLRTQRLDKPLSLSMVYSLCKKAANVAILVTYNLSKYQSIGRLNDIFSILLSVQLALEASLRYKTHKLLKGIPSAEKEHKGLKSALLTLRNALKTRPPYLLDTLYLTYIQSQRKPLKRPSIKTSSNRTPDRPSSKGSNTSSPNDNSIQEESINRHPSSEEYLFYIGYNTSQNTISEDQYTLRTSETDDTYNMLSHMEPVHHKLAREQERIRWYKKLLLYDLWKISTLPQEYTQFHLNVIALSIHTLETLTLEQYDYLVKIRVHTIKDHFWRILLYKQVPSTRRMSILLQKIKKNIYSAYIHYLITLSGDVSLFLFNMVRKNPDLTEEDTKQVIRRMFFDQNNKIIYKFSFWVPAISVLQRREYFDYLFNYLSEHSLSLLEQVKIDLRKHGFIV
ncbi:hypothetical protein NEOKW01_2034 [Nematocida sp. AWRm80]|nr:hypothetical protein NEOKW01_2034 [Nematocida sp. AWRm80]